MQGGQVDDRHLGSQAPWANGDVQEARTYRSASTHVAALSLVRIVDWAFLGFRVLADIMGVRAKGLIQVSHYAFGRCLKGAAWSVI